MSTLVTGAFRGIAGPDAIDRIVLVRGDIADRGAIANAWPAALDDARYQADLGPAPATALDAGISREPT